MFEAEKVGDLEVQPFPFPLLEKLQRMGDPFSHIRLFRVERSILPGIRPDS